jgi:hypothetical protein
MLLIPETCGSSINRIALGSFMVDFELRFAILGVLVVVWCLAADCWEMPVEVRSRTILSPTVELTGLVNEGSLSSPPCGLWRDD